MSAVTQNEYTGNNSTTTYSFTFPYLKTSDIKASLDGVETTAFTLPSATTLQFNTAPGQGVSIKIFRETSVDNLTATFYAGSAIKSEDLNDNFAQNLYVTQEVQDRYVSKFGSTMTGDLTINSDLDVNGSAAIDNISIDGNTITTTAGNLGIDSNGGTVQIADNLTVSGNTTLGDTLASDTVSFTNSLVNSYIVPKADNQYDFGANSLRWKDMYSGGVFYGKDIWLNQADSKLNLGDNPDQNLQLYHNNTNGFIDHNKGDLYIRNNVDGDDDGNIHIQAKSGEEGIVIFDDGQVKIYHDNILAFETNSTASGKGITVHGDVIPDDNNSFNLGSSSKNWSQLHVSGLHGSAIDKTTDSWSGSSDYRVYSTSKADQIFQTEAQVDARIVTKVDEVGGFVPLISEANFPNSNPDINNGAGTIVSVGTLSTSYTPSSGTVTIPDSTLTNISGSNVTITDCGTTVLGVGMGLLVETTSTLHTYKFHRLLAKAADVEDVADVASSIPTVANNVTSINSFSNLYRIASSDPNDHLHDGDLYFDTTNDVLKVYTGSAWEAAASLNGSGGVISGDITFVDNAKLKLGGSGDLKLYHNGNHSKIRDEGTGNLYIESDDGNIYLRVNSNEQGVTVLENGSAELYYDGGTTPKLATTSTGAKVTGNLEISNTVPTLTLTDTDGGNSGSCYHEIKGPGNGDLRISCDVGNNSSGNSEIQFLIHDSEKVLINSDGNLGIGESSSLMSNGKLTIKIDTNKHIGFNGSQGEVDNVPALAAYQDDGSLQDLGFRGNELKFATTTAERMRIDSSGNVGIGETNPESKLHVKIDDTGIAPHTSAQICLERAGTNYLQFLTANNGTSGLLFGDADDIDVSQIKYDHSGKKLYFITETATALTIDQSQNIGIGTASPTVTLDIESASPVIKLTDSDATGTPECEISGAGGDLILSADKDGEKDGSKIYFEIDGNTDVTINHDGQVGIGTTSPNEKVHLHTASSLKTQMQFTNTTTGTAAGDGLILGITGGEEAIIWNQEETDMAFATSNSEAMRIDSDGNVGIGEQSPSTLLHLSGYGTSKIRLTNKDTSLVADQFIGGLEFDKTDGSGAGTGVVGGIRMFSEGSIGESTYLTLSTSDSTTNNQERLRIASSGNVGIGTGTDAVDRKLHVKSAGLVAKLESTTANSLIMFATPTNETANTIPNVGADDNDFTITTGNYERLRVDSSGKVGIKDTTPDADLSVGGDTAFIDVGTAGGNRGKIGYTSNDLYIGTTSSTGDIYFKSNISSTDNPASSGTNLVKIDSSGDVGIGTISPTCKLHIKEAASTVAVQIISGTTTNQNSFLTLANSDSGGAMALGVFGSEADTFGANEANDAFITATKQLALNAQSDTGEIRFGIGATPNTKVLIDSDGNVGIGCTTPLYPLHVKGTVGTAAPGDYGVMMGLSSSNNYAQIQLSGDTGAFIDFSDHGVDHKGRIVYTHADNTMALHTNGGPKIYIDDTGNVGIGEANPTYKTEIKVSDTTSYDVDNIANSQHQLRILNAGLGGTAGLLFTAEPSSGSAGHAGIRVISPSSGKADMTFSVRDGGTYDEKLRIKNDGQVGIGNDNPQQKLSISSGDVSDGIHIQTTSGSHYIAGIQAADNFIAGAAAGALGIRSNNAIHFSSDAGTTSHMRIDNAGDIFIGTDTDIAPANGTNLCVSDSAISRLILEKQDTIKFGLNVSNAFSIYDETNDAERFSINSSGDVAVTDGQFSVTDAVNDTDFTNDNLPGATNGLYVANTHQADGVWAALTALAYDGLTNNQTASFIAKSVAGGYSPEVHITQRDGNTQRTAIKIPADGSVELNYDGSKKLNTISTGVAIGCDDTASNQAISGTLISASLVLDPTENNTGTGIALNNCGSASKWGIVATSSATAGVFAAFYDNSGNGVGSITFGSSGTSYNESSDYRIKENVVDITDGLTRLKQLKPYRFNFKQDTSKTVDGFFAHEAQTVVPEAVTGTKDEVDSKGNPVIQGIDKSKLVPLLTAALQEAIAKIEVLETKVAALEAA